MDVLTPLVAVAAVVMAVIALAVARRAREADGSDHVVATRQLALERQVDQLITRLEALEREIDAGAAATAPKAEVSAGAAAPRRSGPAVAHIGLVRFDAFEDAGGAQSFALALLDDGGNGVVLTSLHSRPTTRVYVRAIRGGAADAPLSDEELRALRQAGLEVGPG